jgi:hypothetical protein
MFFFQFISGIGPFRNFFLLSLFQFYFKMIKKFQLIFTISIMAMVVFMYHDYLNYLSKNESKVSPRPLQMSSSVLNESTPKYGHDFTMVYNRQPSKNSTKYAVFWGYYLFKGGWGHALETMDHNYLESENCPETDCVFTHKYDLLPNIYDYDAVIFNNWNINYTFPPLRSPHQLYIMAGNE